MKWCHHHDDDDDDDDFLNLDDIDQAAPWNQKFLRRELLTY